MLLQERNEGHGGVVRVSKGSGGISIGTLLWLQRERDARLHSGMLNQFRCIHSFACLYLQVSDWLDLDLFWIHRS